MAAKHNADATDTQPDPEAVGLARAFLRMAAELERLKRESPQAGSGTQASAEGARHG